MASIAIHGRTRNEAYTGASDWGYIAQVKSELGIPVFGNGDVKTPADAIRMFETTGVAPTTAERMIDQLVAVID